MHRQPRYVNNQKITNSVVGRPRLDSQEVPQAAIAVLRDDPVLPHQTLRVDERLRPRRDWWAGLGEVRLKPRRWCH